MNHHEAESKELSTTDVSGVPCSAPPVPRQITSYDAASHAVPALGGGERVLLHHHQPRRQPPDPGRAVHVHGFKLVLKAPVVSALE